MAMSTYCCFNRLPPSPNSVPRSPEVACHSKERSWKNKCFLGLTCAIIGLEVGSLGVVGDQERAIAVDMQSGPKIIIRAPRWSDQRACQPWRVNSLETIVPENLPRPSARRRWEAIGFPEAPPPIKVVIKSGAKSCFNL